MRLKLTLAALAATTAFAAPAAAQVATDTETTYARGTVIRALSLSEVTDLDFGTVVASAGSGTVTINADDGSRGVSGGVAAYGLNNGHRATFVGAGPAGDTVSLVLSNTAPGSLVLFNTDLSGATVTATLNLDSTAAAGNSVTIDAAGGFQVGVGGIFDIAANQREGVYEAQFTLTANYN
jgi:hypothetical protein